MVPEKVLGLSTLLLRVRDALADREPTRAAPALAGLCLGFIPAARPADKGGGRPFPSSVEEGAADPVRVRSLSFLLSLTLRALAEVFAVSVTDAGSASVPFVCTVLTSELPPPLSTLGPESGPLPSSDCIACSAEDWREREGNVVVFRRSKGLFVAVPLLAVLEERDIMLSVEEEALIWAVERDGHMEGWGARGVSTCWGTSSAVQRSLIAASSSASSPRSALLVARESSSDVSLVPSAFHKACVELGPCVVCWLAP